MRGSAALYTDISRGSIHGSGSWKRTSTTTGSAQNPRVTMAASTVNAVEHGYGSKDAWGGLRWVVRRRLPSGHRVV